MIVLLLLVCAISAAAETVDIIRDAYGSPHIFATTSTGAVFGAGYAQAEDRADALLRNLGSASVVQSVPLAEPVRAIAEAYVAGVNRYFSEHPGHSAATVTSDQQVGHHGLGLPLGEAVEQEALQGFAVWMLAHPNLLKKSCSGIEPIVS